VRKLASIEEETKPAKKSQPAPEPPAAAAGPSRAGASASRRDRI